jgi:heme A synthase
MMSKMERFGQCLLSDYLPLKAYLQRCTHRQMHPISMITKEGMMVSGHVDFNATIHTALLTFAASIGACQSTCGLPLQRRLGHVNASTTPAAHASTSVLRNYDKSDTKTDERCEEDERLVSYQRQSLCTGYVHSYIPLHIGLPQTNKVNLLYDRWPPKDQIREWKAPAAPAWEYYLKAHQEI